MTDYYGDNPNVTVIVDRRSGPDHAPGQGVRRDARAPRPPPPSRRGHVPPGRRRLAPTGVGLTERQGAEVPALPGPEREIAAAGMAVETKSYKNFIGGEWVDAASGETVREPLACDGRADRGLPTLGP